MYLNSYSYCSISLYRKVEGGSKVALYFGSTRPSFPHTKLYCSAMQKYLGPANPNKRRLHF